MTINTTDLPLSALTSWDGNVRQTIDQSKIAELKSSIMAHGLLQSLVVKQSGNSYEVIAGKRRLHALMQMQDENLISEDFQVPVRIVSDEADAEEISLAENVVREQMHPADQFEAFAALAARSIRLSDIAIRFGVTEGVVAQRLKLSKVAPAIIDSYRAGRITLEMVQAFAVTDNHERQQTYLDDNQTSSYDLNPKRIRKAMTEGDIPGTDKRVRFVGLETYLQAGGDITVDLFDQSPAGTYLHNPSLLNTQVSSKLMAEAERLQNDGWAWVKVAPDFDYSEVNRHKRAKYETVELSAADEDLLKQLDTEEKELQDKCYATDDLTDEEDERLCTIIDLEREQIMSRTKRWPADVKQRSGAMVFIGDNGDFRYEFGLIKPKDEKKAEAETKGAAKKSSGDFPNSSRSDDTPPTSQALLDDLVAHKTAAIAAVLSINPHVALASTVYTMVQDVFVRAQTSALAISLRAHVLKDLPAAVANPKISLGYKDIRDQERTWKETLPGKDAELWAWCLAQDDQTLLRLLAFCAATTVQASATNDDHAAKLAMACNIDMSQWFTPTLENYYSRLSKPQLMANLHEVVGDHIDKSVEKMQRLELAGLAARDIPKSRPGFLPLALRIPMAVAAEPKPTKAAKKKPASKDTAAKKPKKTTTKKGKK